MASLYELIVRNVSLSGKVTKKKREEDPDPDAKHFGAHLALFLPSWRDLMFAHISYIKYDFGHLNLSEFFPFSQFLTPMFLVLHFFSTLWPNRTRQADEKRSRQNKVVVYFEGSCLFLEYRRSSHIL